MNQPSRPIRILLLETDKTLSTPVENILLSKSALRLFHLTAVPNLAAAIHEIERERPEIILTDVDPREESELSLLSRLHAQAGHAPVVALIADAHQTSALTVLQNGAQGYLLRSQFSEDTLPAYLIRTIERHAAQRAIRESEERFRLMIENASDVIFVLDKAGVINYAGPSSKRILDYPPADLTAKNALDFIHRDDRREFLDHFEKAFQTGDTLPSVQFRFRRPEGLWVHMEGKGRIAPDPSGTAVCILNSHDISHRVKLEEELRSLSLRDELTGLHNRRSFTTCLEQQLKLAQRSGKKDIFLLFIDLDGFKGINDTLGHKTGDHALIEAARLLRTTFRDADLVARLGGDEFVVFLTDGAHGGHVDILKKRLSDGVDEWNRKENRPYRLAMSVGVVNYDPAAHRTSEELLRTADELMYKQKREKKRVLQTPNEIATN